MSYDVAIGDFNRNITSNTGTMFRAHIQVGDETGIQALHGLKGKDCVKHLQRAFQSLTEEKNQLSKCGQIGEPNFCAQYDVPNGWGSTVGGLLFLANLLAACATNRKDTVIVSC